MKFLTRTRKSKL